MFLIVFLIVCLFIKMLFYLFLKVLNNRVTHPESITESSLFIDIIVPMFNEEKVILKTINNLLKINYPSFRIILVDDGSTDNGLNLVTQKYLNHPKVVILTQPNSGKSVALNRAIKYSDSPIVVCVDADTLVNPNALKRFVKYFSDDNVAAVSGYIKVGNQDNLITRMQYLEYITNQNYERIIFECVNGILVVPGAISAYKRSILESAGGFNSDTLTEDSDISVKLLNMKYTIRNAKDVIGYTEAPSTIKMFNIQRIRWKVGAIQVLSKYFKLFLVHKNFALKWLVVPYTWVFTIFLPLIAPLADYIFCLHLLFLPDFLKVTVGYFSFILLDSAICYVIVKEYKESISFSSILLSRLLLRQLNLYMYVTMFIGYFSGNLFTWGKIKRYGSVVINNVKE